MAHSVAANSGLAPARSAETPAQGTVEKDGGPWLAITGPLLIALTVAVVSLLSKTSF